MNNKYLICLRKSARSAGYNFLFSADCADLRRSEADFDGDANLLFSRYPKVNSKVHKVIFQQLQGLAKSESFIFNQAQMDLYIS